MRFCLNLYQMLPSGERGTIVADVWGAELPSTRPVVVFLHGGGQTRHAWGSSAKLLSAQRIRAVTVDLKVCGDVLCMFSTAQGCMQSCSACVCCDVHVVVCACFRVHVHVHPSVVLLACRIFPC